MKLKYCRYIIFSYLKMESISTSKCFKYLKSKSSTTDTDDETLISLLSKLLEADPDTEEANCEWIIDQYLAKQFLLEDVDRVREDILMFKELFGERRPLPKKGYSEMKVMIREKSGKGEKKSVAKTTTKTTGVTFTYCKSYFKNVKKTLPDEYKNLSPDRLEELFQKIQDSNPTDDFQNCIWTVEEMKKGNIREEDLPEVKKYLGKYLKLGLPLPNFYPNFSRYSNYQLMKDAVDKNVDLLFTGQEGILLIPQTREAACYYGEKTSWCTAQRNEKNMFEKYAKKGNIYTWFDKKLKDKYQFHFEELEFKDRNNDPISKKRFKEFLNHPVLKIIFDEGLEKIKKLNFVSQINFTNEFYPEWINFIDKEELLNYLDNTDWNFIEPKIKLFVRSFSNEDFLLKISEKELAILKKIIIKALESGNNFSNDKDFKYIILLIAILRGFEEIIPILIKNNFFELAILYSFNLKKRVPEIENFLFSNPDIYYRITADSVSYKDMFFEYIDNFWKDKTDPELWELLEKTDANVLIDFYNIYIKKRSKKLESLILEKGNMAIYNYVSKIIKGRWKEGEEQMLKNYEEDMNDFTDEHDYPLYRYALGIIKGRWPEAERLMLIKYMIDPEISYLDDYLKHFNISIDEIIIK